MIFLNPLLDSLCNFGFKNIGLTPGIPKECFQHPQDIVVCMEQKSVEGMKGMPHDVCPGHRQTEQRFLPRVNTMYVLSGGLEVHKSKYFFQTCVS